MALAVALVLGSILAMAVVEANSLYFENSWHGPFIFTQSWGNHEAASWGSGAYIKGETKGYGRDYYYDPNLNSSVVYWQDAYTYGSIQCDSGGAWKTKWSKSDSTYYYEVGNLNTWHTYIDGIATFPVDWWNPFDSCNTNGWYIYDSTTYYEVPPNYYYATPSTSATGWIACIWYGSWTCQAGHL